MPTPVINPSPWAADAIFTVTDSDFLAVDVNLSELDEEPASLILTLPAGAEAWVLRDPADWSGTGMPLLSGGAWSVAPVILGDWTLSVVPGIAVTDPATLSVTNGTGLGPTGLLRILVRGLANAAATVEPSSGTLSIDRVLADPAINSLSVSSGTPVFERANVTLTASTDHSVVENGGASLPALPSFFSEWSAGAGNPVAISGFPSVGDNANFTAPALYATVNLNFDFVVAYDLANTSSAEPTDPQVTDVLDVTADPVSYGLVMVLDRSGSMGSVVDGTLTKWQIATQAAHACTDLFRAFRPGDNHRAGVVTFEHDNCSWTETPAGNITLRDPDSAGPVGSLQSIATFGDVNNWDLGDDASCTPIGDALMHAWGAIGSDLAPENRAAVILMTDGYENAGETTIAATPGPASQTFETGRTTAGDINTGNDMIGPRVYALAIGTSVDEDRLNDLGAAGVYHRTDLVNEIKPVFAQMLGDVLDANEELSIPVANDPTPPAHPLYYETAVDEQVLAFLVTWDNITDKLRIAWREQTDTGNFVVLDPADPAVEITARGTHGLARVDLTADIFAGATLGIQWRLEHLDSSDTELPLAVEDALVMVDLRTKVDVSFDQPQYFIGDPINLKCQIQNGGAPVTNAEVLVDVARPGEGLGTFLATNADRFKQVKPGNPNTPDPNTGKGLMYNTLLNLLELPGLPIVQPPDFKLHDDGMAPDTTPSDGIFAGAFSDTAKEGTYSFRYRVRGALPNGSRFNRVFVRSTWVGVRPDVVDMVWTVLDGSTGLQAHLLTFTPKTQSGEFLGPFRQANITVKIEDGTLDGDLVDNLDGSYSQRVLSPHGNDPQVTLVIYGQSHPPTSPSRADDGEDPGDPDKPTESCWSLWCRALCCTWKWLRGLFSGGHS